MILALEAGRRVHVLTLLEEKRISVGQAAEALGVTPHQIRRLRVALRREGPSALASKRFRLDTIPPAAASSSP